MERKYYTYIYLDPRKPGNYEYILENEETIKFEYEPFYVGKGTGDRINRHKYKSKEKRRQHMLSKINKIMLESNKEPIKIKIKDDLLNDEAYKLEELIVDKIGRLNDKTGPLINKTKGGYGSNGYIYTEKIKNKMSISIKNYWKNNEHPFKGIKRPKEVGDKISKSRMGLIYDKSSYEKSSKTRGIKPILQYDLQGNFIKEFEFLVDVKNNLNISVKNINDCISGKRNVVSGFVWRRKIDLNIPNKIEIKFKITKKHDT